VTRDDWSKVDSAIVGAMDLPAAEREAFLLESLRGRDDLIEEARALLSYESADDAPLHVLANLGDWAGQRVGPYVIVAKAGEGGMGVVWRARRADGQFERDVAIKFLQTLAPGALTLERFRKERDILARLDHPNIARLLDAGLAGERQPFLVLDWVDGKPIDVYARESKLDVRATLELFRQACSAVDYAHRQLVVHRDIKPSNVFVTAAGEVKLLDFGVAKFLDPGESGDRTATVMRALTPDYSSPEQLLGAPVSTGDDVYSLGILLYELIAGERPFRYEGKTLGEIVSGATNRVPAKPSSVRASVTPDLDAIVMKALRPEAAERYGSVAELSADVERSLEGRPVLARPATPWYVARKFIRRHGVAVGFTTLAFALVAGSAIVAVAQKNRAEQRFSALQQLSHSVIFDYQRDISRLPGTLAVRQKMVQNSLAYLDSLAADAQNDPALLSDVAKGYHQLAIAQGKPSVANLGDFSGALNSAHKSRTAFDRLLKLQPDNMDAACDKGDLLFDISDIVQRVPGQDPAGARAEGIQYWEDLARRYPNQERPLRGLASAMFFKRDLERSLSLYEQIATRFPNGHDPSHDIALLCRTLANRYYVERTEMARGEQLSHRAIEIDEKRVAAAPLDRNARLDLSFDVLVLGDFSFARKDYRSEIALMERAESLRADLVRAAPDDEQAKDRLMFVWYLLGERHGMIGEFKQAATFYQRVVKLGDETLRHSQPNQPFEKWLNKSKAALAKLPRSSAP
jgi:eukaryotic-like serine/threonine-protein kinase